MNCERVRRSDQILVIHSLSFIYCISPPSPFPFPSPPDFSELYLFIFCTRTSSLVVWVGSASPNYLPICPVAVVEDKAQTE